MRLGPYAAGRSCGCAATTCCRDWPRRNVAGAGAVVMCNRPPKRGRAADARGSARSGYTRTPPQLPSLMPTPPQTSRSTSSRPGDERAVARMLLANRPWKLVSDLSTMIAATLGTAAFLVITSNAWGLADQLSALRLLLLSVLSVLVLATWLIVSHGLWEPPTDSADRQGHDGRTPRRSSRCSAGCCWAISCCSSWFCWPPRSSLQTATWSPTSSIRPTSVTTPR